MHRISVYMTIPLSVNVDQQRIFRDAVYASWKIIGDTRFHVISNLPTGFPVEENRNRATKHFLETGADFWLSIDSDNPPLKNPLDLCFLDLDLIGFPTPVYRWSESGRSDPPLHFNGYNFKPTVDSYMENKNRHDLVEVDSIGTGCFLMARRVALHRSLERQPFQRTYAANGFIDKGSDIAFSERVRRLGFKIWCHYGYICDHIKAVSLNTIYRGYHEYFNKWLDDHREKLKG